MTVSPFGIDLNISRDWNPTIAYKQHMQIIFYKIFLKVYVT